MGGVGQQFSLLGRSDIRRWTTVGNAKEVELITNRVEAIVSLVMQITPEGGIERDHLDLLDH